MDGKGNLGDRMRQEADSVGSWAKVLGGASAKEWVVVLAMAWEVGLAKAWVVVLGVESAGQSGQAWAAE